MKKLRILTFVFALILTFAPAAAEAQWPKPSPPTAVTKKAQQIANIHGKKGYGMFCTNFNNTCYVNVEIGTFVVTGSGNSTKVIFYPRKKR